MNILKRNQIIVSVIALMLITAGYFSYTDKGIVETSSLKTAESSTTQNSENVVNMSNTNDSVDESIENKNSTNIQSSESAEIGDAKLVSSNSVETTDDYFSSSRLKRETMYSQMLESYQKILDLNNISEDQKLIAQNEIQKINSTKNSIMISENLIKTKGYDDVVIFVNESSISVIIKAKELKKEDTASIQNIITRELSAKIENIHISVKE